MSKSWWRQALAQQVKGLPLWVWCGLGLAIFVAALLIKPAIGPANPAADYQPGSAVRDSTRLAIDVFVKLSAAAGLMYLFLVLLRRWRAGERDLTRRQILVRERVHLSPRQALYLVQVGDQVLLIGGTDQNLALLGEVEAEDQQDTRLETLQSCTPIAPAIPFQFSNLFTRAANDQR